MQAKIDVMRDMISHNPMSYSEKEELVRQRLASSARDEKSEAGITREEPDQKVGHISPIATLFLVPYANAKKIPVLPDSAGIYYSNLCKSPFSDQASSFLSGYAPASVRSLTARCTSGLSS